MNRVATSPAAGRAVAASAIALLLTACAPLTPRTSLPVTYNASPNFDSRRPVLVVLHHTSSNDARRALRTLTDREREVSAHYLVGRDGRIYYLVDELARAWHAGDSWWAGMRDVNSMSIGIELDNDGVIPYAEPQLASLVALLSDLKARWKIPAANFVGHGDVAPWRKVDPGPNFPWRALAQAGFGLWCDPPYPQAAPGVEDATLLAAFGYDTADLRSALGAFRRHFAPGRAGDALDEQERGMLACLVRKKRAGRAVELQEMGMEQGGERQQ